MKALAKFMVALVATANIALASPPEMWIASVGLDDPIEFGKVPWETLVYQYKEGTNSCPCGSTNLYYRMGKRAHSIALGKEVRLEGKNGGAPEDAYSTVVGAQTTSIGYGNSLVGHYSSITGDCATSVGRYTTVNSWYGAITIGEGASTEYGFGPIAIGLNSKAAGLDETDAGSSPLAIGLKAFARGHGATAIGPCAVADGRMSVQIGPGRNETQRTVKMGDAVFVDVAGIAQRNLAAIDAAQDMPALKQAVKKFVTDLTVPYEMPEPAELSVHDEVSQDYRNVMVLGLLSEMDEKIQSLSFAQPLSEPKESSYTWHDVIQYFIMFVAALVAVLHRKKGKDEEEDEPTDEEVVETKRRRK